MIVTALVPRGADPHEWRPGAAERAALRDADLVVWTGGALDRWAAGSGSERDARPAAARGPARGRPALVAGPGAGRAGGEGDPQRAGARGRERRRLLRGRDRRLPRAPAQAPPRHADLHVAAATGAAPLATQHDGFAYFNDRYGTAVVGPQGAARRWGGGYGPTRSASPAPRPAPTSARWRRTRTRSCAALSHGGENCRPEP